jgi:hypothetical protein
MSILDAGVTQGSEISMFYDPMICKLVTHGPDRASALDRMRYIPFLFTFCCWSLFALVEPRLTHTLSAEWVITYHSCVICAITHVSLRVASLPGLHH